MSERLFCKVILEKQTYPKTKSNIGDWGIMKCRVSEVLEGSTNRKVGAGDLISVKGLLPYITIGGEYKLNATEEFNEKYGTSYGIDFICSNFDLSKKEGIFIFLQSILTDSECSAVLEGIESPLEVLKKGDISALVKIEGIGVAKAKKIIDKFNSNIDYSQIYVELKDVGLTPIMIKKLLDTYSSPDVLVKVIKENPYTLADEIDGIGFKKADEIALSSGISPESTYRISSFIEFILKREGEKGHSYIKPSEIMGSILENLGKVSVVNIKESLSKLKDSKKIMWDKESDRLYLMRFYNLELNILRELKRLQRAKNHFKYKNVEEILESLESKQGWAFTDEQREFTKKGLESNVLSLVGGGGTGKTSTVNALITILSGYSSIGVALAGKAADRLGETTDCETSTIHRLLGIKGDVKTAEFNKGNRMNHIDIIIIDEASMIGGELFYALVQAIESGTKVIMIGDTGQLEAIGECNVFTDIVNGNVVETLELTQIHRQAQKSAIITDSLGIRKGRHIVDEGFTGRKVKGELQDLTIDIHSNALFTAPKVINYFKQGLKEIDILDLQIIVPLRVKGDISVYDINESAQELYNGSNKKFIDVVKMGKKYRLKVGDKVIIRKNNYNTETTSGDTYPVYNGNIGIIEEIDDLLSSFIIKLKNKVKVVVPISFKSGIDLGYAITVHSSQGSQFSNVILGIDYSCYNLLTRELLYTALTRATENCILCAEGRAIRYAVDTTYVSDKKTFLKEWLT